MLFYVERMSQGLGNNSWPLCMKGTLELNVPTPSCHLIQILPINKHFHCFMQLFAWYKAKVSWFSNDSLNTEFTDFYSSYTCPRQTELSLSLLNVSYISWDNLGFLLFCFSLKFSLCAFKPTPIFSHFFLAIGCVWVMRSILVGSPVNSFQVKLVFPPPTQNSGTKAEPKARRPDCLWYTSI